MDAHAQSAGTATHAEAGCEQGQCAVWRARGGCRGAPVAGGAAGAGAEDSRERIDRAVWRFVRMDRITLALPPFRGVTRRLILIALAVFFAEVLIGRLAQDSVVRLLSHVYLFPRGSAAWQGVGISYLPVPRLRECSAACSR